MGSLQHGPSRLSREFTVSGCTQWLHHLQGPCQGCGADVGLTQLSAPAGNGFCLFVGVM